MRPDDSSVHVTGVVGAASLPLPTNLRNLSGHARRWPTVTAVIPTLNEVENLRWLLPRLTAVDEIVIVDGESSDGTVEYVLTVRPDAKVIVEPPTGKGSAMRTGMAAATGEMIIMLDADGSMDPAEFDSFLALLCRGYDFVKGTRYGCGGGSDDLTGLRRVGNSALTWLANRLYRQNWSDLCYGYVAMRRDAVDRLRLESTGFEIETEMCVNAVRAGLRIAEVPSHETERRHGESNLNTWRDGWRVLRTMIRLRFRGPLEPVAGPAAGPAVRPHPAEPVHLDWEAAAFSRTGTE
ncbi:glycosyltransferase family 2 protein [Actinomadura namibiensis]|uniref:Glycosyltransferase involved in cell wall biosynthesis n=1 Tax=Actinomadura namibiensis TaxID=182080 RepID=A0A7W3LJ69_ACTNM|nr:glycosyltransferase family 2 protein [Actinomadura namibiensis]MBA8949171.1 glycosyltransferase involved in cell wall biosynthesis [Actinomadura namibiensis]